MNSDLPARLGDLLGDLGEHTGIDAPVETAIVWSRWREIVGPEIAGHAEPTSLRQGILRVRADSPAWATEIGYLGEEIIRRANAAAGRPVVTEVRLWSGPRSFARGPVVGKETELAKDSGTERNGPSADDPVTVFQRVRATWSRSRARPPTPPS